jgi:hypothetical protein
MRELAIYVLDLCGKTCRSNAGCEIKLFHPAFHYIKRNLLVRA